MSQRTIDRIVGSLFLIAIGAYGGGSARSSKRVWRAGAPGSSRSAHSS
jgi:hypothetical protein